ncbi:hypothetical protein HK100_002507 [Physocladia obscura]|uniref:Major facilitator superfamily (MFS) profile domain-containing protein n=1 Tax=Physocladia obscura TaxID=109957 RepID=A0AAD5SX04_9FUNG|nr:hypothetical protein HK100_002507 [Physocladia obscura]
MAVEKVKDVLTEANEFDPNADINKLNEVISEIGMGTYQWVSDYPLTFNWQGDLSDNMWLQILATILPQVQAEFNVLDSISGLGTSSVYIGMIFGSLGWGIISDMIGRRPAFFITLAIGAVFGTAATFSPNFTGYCILLGLMGLGVGGNLPIDGSLFLEFIPKERQNLLMLMSLFWPIGAVIGALFGWWLIPTYSCDPTSSGYCDPVTNRGWRYTLAAMGLLTFAMLLSRFLFKLQESPKWLIAVGRKEEAIEVLKYLAKLNGKEINITVNDFPDIKLETKAEAFNRFTKSLKELFTKSTVVQTILVWLVWMLISIAYVMFYGFLPKFLETVNTGDPLTLGETYRNFFIQTLAGIPGSVAGTYLIETRLGRKGTMAWGAIGTGISLFLFTTTGNSWWQLFFNCIASFLSNLVYGVIYAYTPEVFKTGHRGTGVGMASCLGRVVGVAAPFLSGYLISINPRIALYLSAALFATMGFVAFFLPVETKGKAAL